MKRKKAFCSRLLKLPREKQKVNLLGKTKN